MRPHDYNDPKRIKGNLSQTVVQILLVKFFDCIYHEMAWTYDWVASIVSIGRWNTWVKTSLKYIHGQKILEIGHGPGHLLIEIMKSVGEIYGIDASHQMTTMACERLKRSSYPINLATARAQNLPFKPEEFDHIISTFPTEYILEERTLEEIYRVLKPDGSAIIVPVAYITGTRLIDKAAAWLFRITGQDHPLHDYTLESSIRTGFEVTSARHFIRNSEVIIILARKKFPKV